MALVGPAVNTRRPLHDRVLGMRPCPPCAAPVGHSRALQGHITLASGTQPTPAAFRCSQWLSGSLMIACPLDELYGSCPHGWCCASAGQNGSTAVAPQTLSINLDAWPQAAFIKVEAIIRPWRLEDVVHDLSKNGIVGMTASNVMGVGVQGGACFWRCLVNDLSRGQRCSVWSLPGCQFFITSARRPEKMSAVG